MQSDELTSRLRDDLKFEVELIRAFPMQENNNNNKCGFLQLNWHFVERT